MPDEDDVDEDLHRLSERLDVLGNALRLKILFYLDEDRKYVSDIAEELNRSQSTTSRHLKVMRYEDILKSKADGRKRYYWVKNKKLLEICKKLRDLFRRDDDSE